MATSEFIGILTCPLCGNESATVHEQKTGTKKGRRYYRCYESETSSVMRCGTIQCIGKTGQIFIAENIRPIGQPEKPATPEPAQPDNKPQQPETERQPIAEPVLVPVRKSRLARLLENLGDE